MTLLIGLFRLTNHYSLITIHGLPFPPGRRPDRVSQLHVDHENDTCGSGLVRLQNDEAW